MKYRYRFNKRTIILSVIESVLLIAGIVLISILIEDSYLKAWLLSILGAVLLLYIMSIPRYLRIDSNNLEIHCVVEMTQIPLGDIRSVREVTKEDTGNLMVLLGSFGFFGYFGYYFSFRDWDTIKVYATEWNNFIEIEDIYEQKYIISCRGCEEFLCSLNRAIKDNQLQRDTMSTTEHGN